MIYTSNKTLPSKDVRIIRYKSSRQLSLNGFSRQKVEPGK